MLAFGANIIAPKKLQSQNITRAKLLKALSYEKVALKTLMKLTPRVDFTNFLRGAFVQVD